MKNFLLLLLTLSLFAAAGCSKKSDEKAVVKPTSTPDAERLKADSERLQQATANAAKEREKASQSTPSPTATP